MHSNDFFQLPNRQGVRIKDPKILSRSDDHNFNYYILEQLLCAGQVPLCSAYPLITITSQVAIIATLDLKIRHIEIKWPTQWQKKHFISALSYSRARVILLPSQFIRFINRKLETKTNTCIQIQRVIFLHIQRGYVN